MAEPPPGAPADARWIMTMRDTDPPTIELWTRDGMSGAELASDLLDIAREFGKSDNDNLRRVR